MARIRRSHLPGAVFHLTARTQGHEPWFSEGLRSTIVEYMSAAVLRTDAQLMAFAVMPNHLHMVVRQGDRPLGDMMQPLLRRTALLVQRSRGVEGHIFERPFRDLPCLDPQHARNAIVYTHLNPVRAGLVDDPKRYRWTSHGMYMSPRTCPQCMVPVLAPELPLGLFASHDGADIVELRREYNRYLAWRVRWDECSTADPAVDAKPPPRPPVLSGDMHWVRSFTARSHGGLEGSERTNRSGSGAFDLEQIARSVLADRAPHLGLTALRSGSKARKIVEVRRATIIRMRAAGYSGTAIARYLRVSRACVSLAVTASRGLCR